MTGYGQGSASSGEGETSVEIRSVNHRFLDLKIRGAHVSPELQKKITELFRQRITRGSVSLVIRSLGEHAAGGLSIDVARAKSLHRELVELAEALNIEAKIDLSTLVNLPGVLQKSDANSETEAFASNVLSAVESGLEQMCEMRAREGQALKTDLESRLNAISAHATELAAIAETAPSEVHQRLRDRLGQLQLKSQSDLEVSEQRIAEEVALMVDRMDVSEELVRIDSHLSQFRELMVESAPVGRRMDFLVQEFGREFNTLGSKLQHPKTASRVVEAKAELEKIREQVQNIE